MQLEENMCLWSIWLLYHDDDAESDYIKYNGCHMYDISVNAVKACILLCSASTCPTKGW